MEGGSMTQLSNTATGQPQLWTIGTNLAQTQASTTQPPHRPVCSHPVSNATIAMQYPQPVDTTRHQQPHRGPTRGTRNEQQKTTTRTPRANPIPRQSLRAQRCHSTYMFKSHTAIESHDGSAPSRHDRNAWHPRGRTTAHPEVQSRKEITESPTQRVHVTATHSLALKRHTRHLTTTNTIHSEQWRRQHSNALHRTRNNNTTQTTARQTPYHHNGCESSAATRHTCSKYILPYAVAMAAATEQLANTATGQPHSRPRGKMPKLPQATATQQCRRCCCSPSACDAAIITQ